MVDKFKALSEESRIRILTLIMEREMCVCEIEACLHMTQSNASRHLTVLKQCGILESCKKAQWAHYRISEKFKEEHKGLWEYLQIKIKELPSYQLDRNEIEKYETIDICTNSNEPH